MRSRSQKEPIVFVELNTRHNDGYAVSLERNRDTGNTRIVVADRRDESLLVFCVPGAKCRRRVPPSVQVRAVGSDERYGVPNGPPCRAWPVPAPPTPPSAGRAALSGWATACRSALGAAATSTSATRYARDQKVLSVLLVCRVCGIETLVHQAAVRTRFEPHPARGLSP